MGETRLAYRTCPLCEATCGLEVTIGPAGVERIRGDAADVFSKGYICPKGASIGEPARTTRTGSGNRTCARRAARTGDGGTAHSPRWSACSSRSSGRRPGRDRGVCRQPDGAQPRRQPLPARLPQDARHAIARTRSARSTSSRSPSRAGCSRLAVHGRDPRRRPHVASPHARRQPCRLERQPRVRPDMRGRLRAIRRAREGGRRRPGADANRARGGRAPLHPARNRRAAARRDGAHPVRRGLADLRGLDAHVTGLDRGTRLRRGVPAGAGRCGPAGSRRRRSAGSHGSSPPRRARRSTAGSGRRCRHSARRRAGSSTS